jgi:hypothetical protein
MVKTLKAFIKKSEEIELSDSDIRTALDDRLNLITYEDLEQYNSIDDVLGEHGACIILYQRERFEGHWTCLWRSNKNNVLWFYDPMGIEMDTEVKLSKFQLRVHNGQEVLHLTHLIEQSNYTVISNTFEHQKNARTINTCGRHCVTRLLFRELNPTQYNTFITNGFSGMDPDDSVSMLTIGFSLQ